MSPPESLHAVLARHMDYSEKAHLLFERFSNPRFDAESLLEQVPSLLHLIGEVSRSDMKDGVSVYSPWLTQSGADEYVSLFGTKFLHWLVRMSLASSYTFPIGSVPAFFLVNRNKDLVSLKYFASDKERAEFMVSRSVLTLPLIDYWFVAFAFLPLIDLGSTTGWTANSGISSNAKWLDENKCGSVYSQVLRKYVGSLASANPLRRGCELMVAVWCDFVLNPMMYTSGGLNYKRLLALSGTMLETLSSQCKSHPLTETFANRLTNLLRDVVSPKSFASKFVHRIDMACCAELVNLWKLTLSSSQEVVGLASYLLLSGPITVFVADALAVFEAKDDSKSSAISALQNSSETKLAINIIVDIIERVEAGRNGPDPLFQETILDSWESCRLLVWHDQRVPKNLFPESERMDLLTQKYPARYSWDVRPTSAISDTSLDAVPRRTASKPLAVAVGASKSGFLLSANQFAATWSTPACSHEFPWIILWIKLAVAHAIGQPLEPNSQRLIGLRKLASAYTIFLIVGFAWIYACLNRYSGLVQLLLLPTMAVVGTKIVLSQYIV